MMQGRLSQSNELFSLVFVCHVDHPLTILIFNFLLHWKHYDFLFKAFLGLEETKFMSLPMFSFFGLMFLEQNFEAGSSWAKVFSRFLGILYLLGAQSCCLSVRIMLFKMYGVIQWGSNLCIWSNHTYVFVLKNTYRSL